MKNFDSEEFVCNCGCGNGGDKMDPELIQGLEELRNLINEPIIVTSAYRCTKHNEKVGGVKNSYHTQGKAADIRVKGMTIAKLASWCEQVEAFRNGGIGVYYGEKFVHVDVGRRRRWRE